MSNAVVALEPNPVFTREQRPRYAWAAIITTTIIMLSIITALIVYAVFRDRRSKSISRCEPGLCVIRYDTGLKRCPNSTTERLVFNPAFEGCTSKSYCQDEGAPCAVLPGGVLDCTGVCGSGNETCACEAAP